MKFTSVVLKTVCLLSILATKVPYLCEGKAETLGCILYSQPGNGEIELLLVSSQNSHRIQSNHSHLRKTLLITWIRWAESITLTILRHQWCPVCMCQGVGEGQTNWFSDERFVNCQEDVQSFWRWSSAHMRCWWFKRILIDFRFSDTAEGLPRSGSPVKISLKKRIFQIAPVVLRDYLNSRWDLKKEYFSIYLPY